MDDLDWGVSLSHGAELLDMETEPVAVPSLAPPN